MSDLEKFVQFARFAYAHGDPICEDSEYDEYIAELKSQGIDLDPVYENDSVPWNIARELNIPDDYMYSLIGESQPFEHSNEYYDILDEAASLSIRSVTDMHEAFAWFSQLKDNTELIFTPKIDGINTRRGYEFKDNKLHYRVSLTRGRSSDAIDVTKNIGNISPKTIDSPDISTNLVVYSETFCKKSDIPYISEKYGVQLKIPRNAGMSMMRVDSYQKSDFDKLHSLVFRCDVADTLSAGIDWAANHGFSTVPYMLYTWKSDMTFQDFSEFILGLITELKGKTDSYGWPTDGVVVEINSRSAFTSADIQNNYSSANLALKIGMWEPGVYQSIVTHIEILQKDEQCNCVALVEPVTTTGGQTVSRVNLFNPAIMINNNINVGSLITFKYKNETTVDLVYGGNYEQHTAVFPG